MYAAWKFDILCILCVFIMCVSLSIRVSIVSLYKEKDMYHHDTFWADINNLPRPKDEAKKMRKFHTKHNFQESRYTSWSERHRQEILYYILYAISYAIYYMQTLFTFGCRLLLFVFLLHLFVSFSFSPNKFSLNQHNGFRILLLQKQKVFPPILLYWTINEIRLGTS